MKPKKFSLGDILRKISQEQTPAPAGETGNGDVSPDRPDAPDSAFAAGAAAEHPAATDRNTSPLLTPDPPGRSEPPYHAQDFSAPKEETAGPRPVGVGISQTHPPRNEMEAEFDLFRYIGILLRRKNVVVIVAAVFSFFSIFQYVKSEKLYTANARLLFKPEEREIIGDQTIHYSGDREKAFNTHLELLRSHTVLTMVAENLGRKVSESELARHLSILQGQTNREKNDIIELSYKSAVAATARDVLNELCKTYIDYRLEVNAQEITRLLFKLEAPIKKLQEDLDKKEGDLRKFKEENRMVQLSDETNLTVSKLSDMEIALQQAQLALIESKDRLASLSSQISKQDQNIIQSVTFTDPIRDKLAALELEYNTLSAENSPEHFKVKMIKQQIDKLKAAAVDSLTREAASRTLVKNPIRQTLLQDLVNLNIERSALEAKRIALEKVIEKLNSDLLKLPSVEQKYAFLQRETESLLQTLRLLKTKYEETKIRRESQETDIKILELAYLPTQATSAIQSSSILIGILIGLILGMALAFLLEYLDQSVKDPLDIEKALGLPLLGIVPLIETNNALIQKSSDLTKTILEPFRTLRANLKHLAATYRCQTFMICSAVKGEGKTTLAANLAITFALDGKRTILIDADLRRSQMHNLFSIPKETGLSDFLLGIKTVDEIMKKSVYEHLFVITSGERPHNPAELLGTYRFDLLVQELKKRGDIIIFDTAALLPVSDGITMASKMDACIVILRTLWTPLKAAKQTVGQLSRMGCHILGGIFNGVTARRAYYPYYYGYYGYYSYTKYVYEDEPRKKASLREIGLRIENSLKSSIRSFRYALPRRVAAVGSFTRHLARKKIFFILIAAFLSLTGIELWLSTHSAPKQNDEAGITYLSVTGSATGEQAPVFRSDPSPMPVVNADSAATVSAIPENNMRTEPSKSGAHLRSSRDTVKKSSAAAGGGGLFDAAGNLEKK